MAQLGERATTIAVASTVVSSVPALAAPSGWSTVCLVLSIVSSAAAILAVRYEKSAAADRHKRVADAQADMQIWAIEQHKSLQLSLAKIELNQKILGGRFERLIEKANPDEQRADSV